MDCEKEMLAKLDLLVRLTAANAVNGKNFKDQVKLLSSVGLTPKEIGTILDKSPNNVSVTLNYLKKTGKA